MKARMRMHWVATAVAAMALAACGGGGGSTTPADTGIKTVKTMGDSLTDVGTFGFKATVQNAGNLNDAKGASWLWVDHVANRYNNTLCAHYRSSDAGATFSTTATCNSYAVAGGRINNFSNPQSPVSITKQMADAGAAGFAASDLVLIDGGGNDAGDLFGAYLAASSDGGKTFFALIGSMLDAATVQALAAQGAAGMPKAGAAYMQALAGYFAKNIQTNVLGKGATRVAVLNMPGVTLTPKFQMVLKKISATQGAAAAAQLNTLFDTWVQTFNTQLNTSLGTDARLTVVDFYESFRDQAANPAQYSYQNVTDPVCAPTGQDASGLPTYSFPTCTADSLSARTPPTGATGGADWWRSYGFADSFHPTPYGHRLMSQLTSRSLSRAGWY
ncbi:SGNH/GDSL hydrolase family protein [Diaphorobacter caeni]|uniref:SGNH/GDSL hydrolase family protein n=1 Tax=Diaphorobacter caeni TaxID=2784387 RepID=UPI00188F9922|nr:SGNH/GDSL hydrolase family protein [Diaphorobacter caeni]MBF5005627.1 phospholipase [Diaphorobacter caeni]